MTRKLENIYQGLTLPAEQGEVTSFLANTENAQRINSLVEAICEAMMEYQVRIVTAHFFTMSDLCIRCHYNKISITRVANSL